MTICRDCNILIQPVIPLSNDKHNKFCRCPKCYSATKHQIIRCGELVFGELLEKEGVYYQLYTMANEIA